MKDKEIFPTDPEKTYGLMEIVEGTSPHVDKKPEDTEETYPHLIFREIIAVLLLIVFVSLLALFFNAPLEEIANPNITPNPAKAPWYFLGLQELLHYFPPVVAGVLIPSLIVILLISLPFIDRNPSTKPKKRKIAIAIFTFFVIMTIVLTVIGTFFRAESWHWVWPWK